jgi:hypothetical protein
MQQQGGDTSNRGDVLGYRTPGTGLPRVQRVLAELAMAEKVGMAGVATKLAIGVPLTLVGPLFITVVLLATMHRTAGRSPGFLMTFIVICGVVVPLLMWLERRTRGEFFSDSVRGETSPFRASSYGEYELQSAKFTWIGYTEIALTGPRLVWEAIDTLRAGAAGPVDQPLRVTAAAIVVELLDAGEGKLIRALVRPERPMRDVQRVVNYLLRREWAGISTRRDRIWLASDVRERLGRL